MKTSNILNIFRDRTSRGGGSGFNLAGWVRGEEASTKSEIGTLLVKHFQERSTFIKNYSDAVTKRCPGN